MSQPRPADAGDWPFEPDPEVEAVLLDDPGEDAQAPPPLPSVPPVTSGAASSTGVADHLGRTAEVARVGAGVVATLFAGSELSREWPAVGATGFVRFASIAGGGVLAGVVVGRLLAATAALVRVLTERSQSFDRIAARVDALAEAVEAGAIAGRGAPRTAADALAEVRQAIRSAKWDDADRLVEDFAASRPESSEASAVVAELAGAKASAASDLRVKIAAAQAVNDPDRVIELREALRPLQETATLRALDVELARWFMTMIHRRLRSGAVRADVVLLAGRVAESLDETAEGASLRASLPTLRRAAGLCPRCAQPYKGLADACPACLQAASPAPPRAPQSQGGPPPNGTPA